MSKDDAEDIVEADKDDDGEQSLMNRYHPTRSQHLNPQNTSSENTYRFHPQLGDVFMVDTAKLAGQYFSLKVC